MASTTDLRSRDFRKILLIKLSAVGDVVHTIPVLNKLRARYPAARIDWLVTPAIAELLRHNPAISNVIEFAREEWSAPWRPAPFIAYARLAAKLRATGYDWSSTCTANCAPPIFARATGAPVRIGFDRPRASVWDASPRKFPKDARRHAWQGAREGSWIAYTHHIPVPTLDLHAVDRYLNVGPLLGLTDGPADFSFPIPAAADSGVEALLRRYGMAGKGLVTMAPGTIWETKHWGSDKFAEVARHFLRGGYAVALMGSGRERAVCDEVARLAPGAVDVAGETSLTELAALIRRSAICVDQQFRPDASRRRARPAGRQRVRADRSDLDRTIPSRRRGVAGRREMLAVLSAAAQPLPERSRLHAARAARRRDRAGGGVFCTPPATPSAWQARRSQLLDLSPACPLTPAARARQKSQATDRCTSSVLRPERRTGCRHRLAGKNASTIAIDTTEVSHTTAPHGAASHSPTAATRSMTAKNTVAVCHATVCASKPPSPAPTMPHTAAQW